MDFDPSDWTIADLVAAVRRGVSGAEEELEERLEDQADEFDEDDLDDMDDL